MVLAWMGALGIMNVYLCMIKLITAMVAMGFRNVFGISVLLAILQPIFSLWQPKLMYTGSCRKNSTWCFPCHGLSCYDWLLGGMGSCTGENTVGGNQNKLSTTGYRAI